MKTSARNIIESLITIIVTLAVVVGGFFLMLKGLDKQAVVDCLVLENQAGHYDNFYLLKWQDEMCRTHGIVINAPVKE